MIPYKEPEPQKMEKITELVQQLLSDDSTPEMRSKIHNEIDDMISTIYE